MPNRANTAATDLSQPPYYGGATPKDTAKLRLMVSYGGHILPRPHDKTLFYAGGDTRIVSLPRNPSLSLSSLRSHLSKSLLGGSRAFSLKYQLPNHDLDSLISISSDEDLMNMIDEHDRISSSNLGYRIRFFLFRNGNGKEEDPADGLKRDDSWFADALKVAGSNLVNLNGGNDAPESIVLESSSSFGSNSSSNSPGNKCSCGEDFKVVLPSVDSLGSDCSLPSPNFSQQAIVYQDASGFLDSKLVSANLIDTESNASDRSPRSDLLSPVQVSSYMVSKPMEQPQLQSPPQQAPTAASHYIQHPTSQTNYVTQHYPGAIPVASYAPMYQPYVQPQQPVQYQHHLHKPYQVYMMPIGQTQHIYDVSTPRTLTAAQTAAVSQPQMPSNHVMIPSPLVYEGFKTATTPEYAANVYGTPSVEPNPVTLPSVNQPPVQPITISPIENTNYINDFEDPMHAQIYKTQPSGSILPSHIQMATTAATMMLSENFSQLQVDNTKH